MYTILTDSCTDFNPEIVARFEQLEILPMSYTIGGVTSTQAFSSAEASRAYYDRLRAGGNQHHRAGFSRENFLEAFKAHAAKGEAVLGVIFSSALSGTFARPTWPER